MEKIDCEAASGNPVHKQAPPNMALLRNSIEFLSYRHTACRIVWLQLTAFGARDRRDREVF
jgi:hypothetical protein